MGSVRCAAAKKNVDRMTEGAEMRRKILGSLTLRLTGAFREIHSNRVLFLAVCVRYSLGAVRAPTKVNGLLTPSSRVWYWKLCFAT